MLLSDNDLQNLTSLLHATRENMDRIDAILNPDISPPEDDLDVANPLNKSGQTFTVRGTEVCYRLFDAGKTRYAVAKAMNISYGAATYRHHAWHMAGGKTRTRQPLD
jgi:hypothetical protein